MEIHRAVLGMRHGTSIRHVATAIALIAGLIATTTLCWIAALGGQPASMIIRNHLPHIVVLCCATIAAYAIIWFAVRNKYLRWTALVLVLIFVWAAKAVDLTFLYYFNARFLELRPFLPVRAETVSVGALVAYATQYISLLTAACAGLPFLLSLIVYSRIKTSHVILGATAAAFFLISFTTNRLGLWQVNNKVVPHTLLEIVDTADRPLLQLKSLNRSTVVRTGDVIRKKPRTIVLAINESNGFDFPSSDKQVPLRTKLAELSGAPQRWIPFENAVTNSNATDVSIPSIVTGSGTHEGFEKLHAMPFLFDLAKARGYKTALITSSVMRWAGFEQFFAGALIDYLYAAEVSGQPLANDLAIDDAFAFKKLTDHITQATEDIFIVFYVNALHPPVSDA